MVAESWRRCAVAGLDTGAGLLPPVRMTGESLDGYRRGHSLAPVLPLLAELLGEPVGEAGHVFAVSDADGMLLTVAGDPDTLRRVERINFVEGAVWSEAQAGTNAPGTALAAGTGVQIIATEHYNPLVRRLSCAAVPVFDPDSGRALGAVDVTGTGPVGGPYALGMVRAAARVAEAELARALVLADERARRVYARRPGPSRAPAVLVSAGGRVLATSGEHTGRRALSALAAGGGDLAAVLRPVAVPGETALAGGARVVTEPLGFDGYLVVRLASPGADPAARPQPASLRLAALGRDRATVEVAGSTLRLRPRQSEIMVTLALARPGRSASRLAVDLCAGELRPVTVRAEVSRLRAALGADVLTSQPYALRVPVRGDYDTVRELVAEGRVPEAFAAYPGPLLPTSQAPAVVEQRDLLDQQLRAAVRESADAVLLRRWVESPWGVGDGCAWRALADLLPGGSPQRAAAASRARALVRIEWGR